MCINSACIPLLCEAGGVLKEVGSTEVGLEGVGSADVGREGGGVGSAASASLARLRDGRRSCFCFTASSCLRSAQHTGVLRS